MTSSCAKCGMPNDPARAACQFCGTPASQTSVATPSAAQQPFRASGARYRARGKSEDLLLYLIDLLLLVLTLGLGWLIWSAVLGVAGQTPAGKIRDQVLVSVRNSIQAPAWKIIFRQLFTFIVFGYLLLTVVSGFDVLIDVGGYYFATYGIPATMASLMLLDALLTLSPLRRRLIDWALAIRWTDGNGHSFRNYKPQGVQ